MSTSRKRIVIEELSRTAAWIALSFLGWSFIYTSMEDPPISGPVTAFLAALTALGFSIVMIAVRLQTGWELGGQTESEQELHIITGSFIGLFVFLYLVLVQGRTPLLLVAYLVANGVGFVIWRRVVA